MEQHQLFQRSEADVRAEIAKALSNPDGQYLSKEAQQLYEADGAKRFAKFHPSLAQRFKATP